MWVSSILVEFLSKVPPPFPRKMGICRICQHLILYYVWTCEKNQGYKKKLIQGCRKYIIIYHLTPELNWEPSLIQPVGEVEIQLEKDHTGSQ